MRNCRFSRPRSRLSLKTSSSSSTSFPPTHQNQNNKTRHRRPVRRRGRRGLQVGSHHLHRRQLPSPGEMRADRSRARRGHRRRRASGLRGLLAGRRPGRSRRLAGRGRAAAGRRRGRRGLDGVCGRERFRTSIQLQALFPNLYSCRFRGRRRREAPRRGRGAGGFARAGHRRRSGADGGREHRALAPDGDAGLPAVSGRGCGGGGRGGGGGVVWVAAGLDRGEHSRNRGGGLFSCCC